MARAARHLPWTIALSVLLLSPFITFPAGISLANATSPSSTNPVKPAELWTTFDSVIQHNPREADRTTRNVTGRAARADKAGDQQQTVQPAFGSHDSRRPLFNRLARTLIELARGPLPFLRRRRKPIQSGHVDRRESDVSSAPVHPSFPSSPSLLSSTAQTAPAAIPAAAIKVAGAEFKKGSMPPWPTPSSSPPRSNGPPSPITSPPKPPENAPPSQPMNPTTHSPSGPSKAPARSTTQSPPSHPLPDAASSESTSSSSIPFVGSRANAIKKSKSPKKSPSKPKRPKSPKLKPPPPLASPTAPAQQTTPVADSGADAAEPDGSSPTSGSQDGATSGQGDTNGAGISGGNGTSLPIRSSPPSPTKSTVSSPPKAISPPKIPPKSPPKSLSKSPPKTVSPPSSPPKSSKSSPKPSASATSPPPKSPQAPKIPPLPTPSPSPPPPKPQKSPPPPSPSPSPPKMPKSPPPAKPLKSPPPPKPVTSPPPSKPTTPSSPPPKGKPNPVDNPPPPLPKGAGGNGDGDWYALPPPVSPSSKPVPPGAGGVYDVRSFGAKGDGKSDDGKALQLAFAAACAASANTNASVAGGSVGNKVPTMLIPGKYTFHIMGVSFIGPCGPGVNVQLDGNITVPMNPASYIVPKNGPFTILYFKGITGLKVFGSGVVDGRGQMFWERARKGQGERPMLVYFFRCNQTVLSGITLRNPAFFHVQIFRCANVRIFDFRTDTPADSINTDGIHISSSFNIDIRRSILAGGDDNVSIWDGAVGVTVSNVTCLTGHGISIGALGSATVYPISCVSDITVKDVKFLNTKIGLRIKTFQGGAGMATNIVYDGITMVNVRYPIVLDQFYCGGSLYCYSDVKTSNVAIANVSYSNIQATTMGPEGIIFRCSRTVPCTGVYMDGVNITSPDPAALFPTSLNVYGTGGLHMSQPPMVMGLMPGITEIARIQRQVASCVGVTDW